MRETNRGNSYRAKSRYKSGAEGVALGYDGVRFQRVENSVGFCELV